MVGCRTAGSQLGFFEIWLVEFPGHRLVYRCNLTRRTKAFSVWEKRIDTQDGIVAFQKAWAALQHFCSQVCRYVTTFPYSMPSIARTHWYEALRIFGWGLCGPLLQPPLRPSPHRRCSRGPPSTQRSARFETVARRSAGHTVCWARR